MKPSTRASQPFARGTNVSTSSALNDSTVGVHMPGNGYRTDRAALTASVDSERRRGTATLESYCSAAASAVAVMHDEHSESVRVADLARSVHMSPQHFSRAFRIATGVPPSQFLAAVRIHRAKRRLLETNDTIASVACSVGYNSVGTFSRTFKAYVGCPPSELRRLSTMIGDTPLASLRAGCEAEGWGTRGSIHVEVRSDCELDVVVVVSCDSPVPRTPMRGFHAAFSTTEFSLSENWRHLLQASVAVGFTRGATARDALAMCGEAWRVGSAQDGRSGDERGPHVHLREPSATDPPFLPAIPLMLAQHCLGVGEFGHASEACGGWDFTRSGGFRK